MTLHTCMACVPLDPISWLLCAMACGALPGADSAAAHTSAVPSTAPSEQSMEPSRTVLPSARPDTASVRTSVPRRRIHPSPSLHVLPLKYAMPSRGVKKRLLQKWSAANNAASPSSAVIEATSAPLRRPAAPASPAAPVSPAAVAGGVRKLRRYPKLLTLDANGVPVSVRGAMRASSPAVVLARRESEEPQYWRRNKGANMRAAPPVESGGPLDALELLRLELERVQRAASTRFHIKMNLRGRSKLAAWLAAVDADKLAAAELAVPKLALSERLLVRDVADVRIELTSMRNSPLRVLEALAARLDAKDGAANWAFIVRNAGAPHTALARDQAVVRATDSTAVQAVRGQPAYTTELSAVAAASRERTVM